MGPNLLIIKTNWFEYLSVLGTKNTNPALGAGFVFL